LGDCLEVLEGFDSNLIDTCITDPPYGLSFMGKDWDHGIPGVPFWQAVLRVLKPGAILLAFGGTRTYHRLACAIEDSGFEIRDCMMWLYGSGFPKSLDISKAKDDRNWNGWGTALKPAWEPILVAMKPLDGTFAQNAEKWGVAGLNVDGGRIGTERFILKGGGGGFGTGWGKKHEINEPRSGRFPANLLLDEEAAAMLEIKTSNIKPRGNRGKSTSKNKRSDNCVPLGFRSSHECGIDCGYGDSGGASRFFYTAKASQSDRNSGPWGPVDGLDNRHPTVKPTKLLEYLCTLTKTPTEGIVLDPFMGSGSTGVAAVRVGRPFIGIEKDPESFSVAERRLGCHIPGELFNAIA